jgi:hypothetical protein
LKLPRFPMASTFADRQAAFWPHDTDEHAPRRETKGGLSRQVRACPRR